MLVSIDYRYAFIMSWLIKISNRLSSWQVGPQIVKKQHRKTQWKCDITVCYMY